MKKLLFALLISLTFGAGFTGTAQAFEELKASPWTLQESYEEKVIHKLGFGVLNVATGWTALPYEIERNWKTNIFTGLIKGTWRLATNTIGGALHAATFPIPVDIPLPEGGVHFD